MTPLVAATVVFGDVVGSRDDPGTPEFLRALRDDLEAAYGKGRLAPSGFTQGDELQLLLAPGYDPFQAVLRAALRPDARGIRWAIVGGDVLAGTGPAPAPTGPAPRPSGGGRPSLPPASSSSARRPVGSACLRGRETRAPTRSWTSWDRSS